MRKKLQNQTKNKLRSPKASTNKDRKDLLSPLVQVALEVLPTGLPVSASSLRSKDSEVFIMAPI